MNTIFIPSMAHVDFSDMILPGVVIYSHPDDYADWIIARIWELSIPRPTNLCIKSADLKSIRIDLMNSGFKIRIPRDDADDPCVVETWMR